MGSLPFQPSHKKLTLNLVAFTEQAELFQVGLSFRQIWAHRFSGSNPAQAILLVGVQNTPDGLAKVNADPMPCESRAQSLPQPQTPELRRPVCVRRVRRLRSRKGA